jgi:hypothetical protein
MMQIKPGDFGGEKRNRDVSAQGSGIRDFSILLIGD